MFRLSNANSKLHSPITSNKSKNPTMLTSKPETKHNTSTPYSPSTKEHKLLSSNTIHYLPFSISASH